ncbi:hypothetical protein HO173_012799 [Letharia columbiana]|uniref:Uncharacterized protein n=1 Tax=Letharia columbiana TaxID=112416 RepID=A0A8H6CLM6_9LECA|nr:uncharacterized protein HO173_012799 [Letharia columbiana]KAF6225361.1 hypothetical protein HO173_012799 [Letharia columbiana]
MYTHRENRGPATKGDILTRSSTCSIRHDSIIRGRTNRRETDTIRALKVNLASLMVEKSKHVDNEMDKVMREIVPRPASGHVPRIGSPWSIYPDGAARDGQVVGFVDVDHVPRSFSGVMEIEKSDTGQVEGPAAGEEPEDCIIAWG